VLEQRSHTMRPANEGHKSLRTFLRRAVILASLFSPGCANFWDEITDRNFEFKSLYTKPNPYVVLHDSTDGGKRAKALRSLHEPSQFGGTAEEQETVVKILTTAAVSEHTAVARMAAIEALSKFKDPRAADALIAAYYAADKYRTVNGDDIKYPGEMANTLRCQSLQALGRQGNPKAVEHLVTVLKQPPARGAEPDKQMVMDERIAAARALAKFHDPRGEEALLNVMKSEKDIALKDCAHESLQAATGKKLPADPEAWGNVLNTGNGADAFATRNQQPQPVQQAGYRQTMNPGAQTFPPAFNGPAPRP
jgi:HEAT repeat protein